MLFRLIPTHHFYYHPIFIIDYHPISSLDTIRLLSYVHTRCPEDEVEPAHISHYRFQSSPPTSSPRQRWCILILHKPRLHVMEARLIHRTPTVSPSGEQTRGVLTARLANRPDAVRADKALRPQLGGWRLIMRTGCLLSLPTRKTGRCVSGTGGGKAELGAGFQGLI